MTDLPTGVVRLKGKLHLRGEDAAGEPTTVPFADLLEHDQATGRLGAADVCQQYRVDFGLTLPEDGVAFALAYEQGPR